jgi:hypothetical protein
MSKEIDVTLHSALGLHATGYHQSAHVLLRSLTKAELFELGDKNQGSLRCSLKWHIILNLHLSKITEDKETSQNIKELFEILI